MHDFSLGVQASFLNLPVTFQYSLGLDVSMLTRLFNHLASYIIYKVLYLFFSL